MDEKRFWSNVDKKGPNDCWEWKGYVGWLNTYRADIAALTTMHGATT